MSESCSITLITHARLEKLPHIYTVSGIWACVHVGNEKGMKLLERVGSIPKEYYAKSLLEDYLKSHILSETSSKFAILINATIIEPYATDIAG